MRTIVAVLLLNTHLAVPVAASPPAPPSPARVVVVVTTAPPPRPRPARASRAATPPPPAIARPEPRAQREYPSEAHWRALALCESGGDPRSVSATGRYRGLYQFDLATWRAVGGEGDPAVASPAEQTDRARRLYRRAGWRPWPGCRAKLGLP